MSSNDAEPFSGMTDGEDGYALSRRSDLGQAVGLIVTLPEHSGDERGKPVWGEKPEHGMYSDEAFENFSRGMEAAVDDAISYNDRVPPLVRKRPSHLYETGPAAQTWPQLALMLWEDVRPYLQDTDMLVSLGLAVEYLKQRRAGLPLSLNWNPRS